MTDDTTTLPRLTRTTVEQAVRRGRRLRSLAVWQAVSFIMRLGSRPLRPVAAVAETRGVTVPLPADSARRQGPYGDGTAGRTPVDRPHTAAVPDLHRSRRSA